jgi:hypothetical protein
MGERMKKIILLLALGFALIACGNPEQPKPTPTPTPTTIGNPPINPTPTPVINPGKLEVDEYGCHNTIGNPEDETVWTELLIQNKSSFVVTEIAGWVNFYSSVDGPLSKPFRFKDLKIVPMSQNPTGPVLLPVSMIWHESFGVLTACDVVWTEAVLVDPKKIPAQ